MKIKLLSYIIPLFLGALIAWAIIPRGNDRKDDLQMQRKYYLNQIDSIHTIQKVLVGRDSFWTRTHAQDRDSLMMARTQTNKWRGKYNDIKNTPVVRYTVPQLDSVVSALVNQ